MDRFHKRAHIIHKRFSEAFADPATDNCFGAYLAQLHDYARLLKVCKRDAEDIADLEAGDREDPGPCFADEIVEFQKQSEEFLAAYAAVIDLVREMNLFRLRGSFYAAVHRDLLGKPAGQSRLDHYAVWVAARYEKEFERMAESFGDRGAEEFLKAHGKRVKALTEIAALVEGM
jgi:hypothetical protein